MSDIMGLTRQDRDEWLKEVDAIIGYEQELHMSRLNRDIDSIMKAVDNKGAK